ncbi:MAG: hypothetical protein FD164_1751 [Nitrospirae bacterium]|nr:MAG: hypothetical protein FD164_1751 [Nitrospirota bacterium]
MKRPHLFCRQGLQVRYQRLAEVPGAAEGALVARQPAPGGIEELAGVGLVPVALIARYGQLQAEGVHKIMQVKRAVAVDAADVGAARADDGGLLLEERIDCIDQLAHTLCRLPRGSMFRRVGAKEVR